MDYIHGPSGTALKYSSTQLADLAGNGFASPCSLAVDVAVLLAAGMDSVIDEAPPADEAALPPSES